MLNFDSAEVSNVLLDMLNGVKEFYKKIFRDVTFCKLGNECEVIFEKA